MMYSTLRVRLKRRFDWVLVWCRGDTVYSVSLSFSGVLHLLNIRHNNQTDDKQAHVCVFISLLRQCCNSSFHHSPHWPRHVLFIPCVCDSGFDLLLHALTDVQHWQKEETTQIQHKTHNTRHTHTNKHRETHRKAHVHTYLHICCGEWWYFR